MAERVCSVVVDKVNMKVIKWTGLLNGDTGAWYTYSGKYPDKCFQVFGTFGAGGTVVLQGTCEEIATPANPLTLSDVWGVAISKTAAAIVPVAQSPAQIRPSVTAGDGTTNLTVYLTIRG